MLIDAGANAECKPVNLLQFGMMGSAYMKGVLGVQNPRVALVNIGTEQGKEMPSPRRPTRCLKSPGLTSSATLKHEASQRELRTFWSVTVL